MIFWEKATNTISKQQEGNYLHNTPTPSHYIISPYPPEVSFLIYVTGIGGAMLKYSLQQFVQ